MQPERLEAVTSSGAALTCCGVALPLGAGYFGYLLATSGRFAALIIPLGVAAVGVLLLFAGVRQVGVHRAYRTRRAEVLASGLRTEGVVTSVNQIHSQYHARPGVQIVLRYRTPDGRAHSALARYAVPILMLDAIRPGTRWPIIADVDDPLSPHTFIDWDHRLR